jgi:UDP-N-acetylmuramoyl-L-alanyl-D-glutamate--2,6-diaminopimelate ligase
MKLKEILSTIEVIDTIGNTDIEIEKIFIDSRRCEKGSLFIAVKGIDTDGHEYIAKAIENGAKIVVYEEESYKALIKEKGVTGIRIANSRVAVALIADNFYDHPSSKLYLVGVTGTNGKTTIATLLYNLFTSLGYGCGLLSTIANYVEKDVYPTINTTPDPISINSLMAEMVKRGCGYCFMEVSSHSLDQDRVAGLKFKGAIFTNLTHDHLDYHKTFAEYLRCKKKLFDSLDKNAFALINIDDKNGKVMVQNTKAKVYEYSLRTAADFKVKIIEKSIEGSLLNMDGKDVWTRFIGVHNAHNLIAVYGAAILLGASKDEVLTEISNLKSVAGRLEYIKGGNDITAVIDYAHTPDALENVLATLKDISADNELVAVFGCGGNRDKTKRPEMGAIAEKWAERIIVTSDNPRFENPEQIILDIKEGMSTKGRAKSLFITDRKEGIRTALMTAKPGSIILIAGKGHEDYQIVNGVKSHFDDKEIVKEFFEELTK